MTAYFQTQRSTRVSSELHQSSTRAAIWCRRGNANSCYFAISWTPALL